MSMAGRQIKWERFAAGDVAPGRIGQRVPELVRIGKRMRALYEEVAQEPVPHRLLNLLERLEERPA